MPGDPLETMIAESGTSITTETLKKELGLDQPMTTALFSDLNKLLHLDFGRSLITKMPITNILKTRWLNSIFLSTVSLFLGIIISLFLGLIAAKYPNGKMDQFCTFYGGVMAALPTVWTGIICILLFSVWIPIFKYENSIFLPAITLALHFSSFWARVIRNQVAVTLQLGAATGARARGVHEWKVLLKYGLIPSSGGIIAYLATQTGHFLSGSYVMEILFSWEGLGSLLVHAVLQRDYPVVENATFISASMILIANSLGDWIQLRLVKR